MATLILDLENNTDIEEIISAISLLKGIKKIELKQKSKTQELLDKMEAGEYVSDDEYIRSIPGLMEELDAASNEIKNTPPEQRIKTLGTEWDV